MRKLGHALITLDEEPFLFGRLGANNHELLNELEEGMVS